MTADSTVPESFHWSWGSVLTDPVRLAVLRALCDLGTATAADLGSRCHTSDRTVRRHLRAMKALGLVHEQLGERDGLTPGRPASRFTIDVDTAVRIRSLLAVLREPLEPKPAPD